MPGPIFFVVMAAKMYLAAHAIIAFFVISGLTTVVSYGLGKLAQVLTRKPAGGQATAERAGMQVTRRGSAEPRRLVYGRVRAGGVFSFFHVGGTAGEYLYTVISLSGRKLTKIGIDNTGGSEFMYFDGVAVPLVASGSGYIPSAGAFVDHVYVETNLGDADQTALGQTLTDYTFKALWTSAHRQRGCAHVLIRLKYNDAVFTSGLPNITFDLKGAAVYDPRDGPGYGDQEQGDPSTWEYSANPALIAADFLTDPDFGHGAAYARLDETALIAAAGICDYLVALDTSPPSSEPRYEFNGVILTSQKPGEILLDMSNSMAGYIVGVVGGLWMIYAGAWRAPAITLTESDIISPIRMVSKVSRRELINAVKGTYLGDLTQWQPSDFPPVTNATYLTEDGGDQLWADVTLPYTTSVTMAQRLAKTQLERSRRQKTLEFTAKLGAYRLQPADTVYVTNTRLGFSAKTFEVTESRLTVEDSGGAPALGVALTLREADAAIYTWSSSEEGDIGTPGVPTLPGATPANTGSDTDYPTPPDTFLIQSPRRWGMLCLSALEWTAGPINVDSLHSAVFDVWSYDEIAGHSTNLFGGIDNSTPTLILIDNGYAVVGDHLYIDQEEMEIQTKSLDGQTITVARGVNASTPAAHLDAAPVWFLTRSSYWITLAPAMTATELLDWFVEIYMPYLRVASAGVSLINSWGTSPPAWVTGLNTLDPGTGSAYGVRTGGGAMTGIEKPGLLETGDPGVESDYIEQPSSIRDVFATLAGASSSGPVTVQALHKRMVAGSETTVQTIAVTFLESAITSDIISGVSLQPEAAADWYTLNITAAGTGAYGLEVFIRR